MPSKVLVWDAPTRTYHWLQALVFLGAYLTSDSERHRDIHVTLGYILLGLLVFRLLWGFVGTRYARFDSFMFKPGQIFRYVNSLLKRNAAHFTGHNPVGSIAIWLLMGLGLIICVTGVILLQYDDAPDFVDNLHDYATETMLAVIAIHLIGVFMSSVLHKENLVGAMITGAKSATPEHGIHKSYNWLAIVMLLVVFAFGFWYLQH